MLFHPPARPNTLALVGAFSHFKSPHGRRLDLILRARRLKCGVYGALTIKNLRSVHVWTLIHLQVNSDGKEDITTQVYSVS